MTMFVEIYKNKTQNVPHSTGRDRTQDISSHYSIFVSSQ